MLGRALVSVLVVSAAAGALLLALRSDSAPPPASGLGLPETQPVCASASGTILRSNTQIFVQGTSGLRSIFGTEGLILNVLPVQRPRQPLRLVILAVEKIPGRPRGSALSAEPLYVRKANYRLDDFDAHPLRSHLYLLDPADPARVTRLSPEPGYNFWHLSQGDVDGDGDPEIGLCTWSRTVLDPRYAARFFVYSWKEQGDLYPRWRGSRLCRPFVQACLADVNDDGKAELVSVEKEPDGGEMLVAYEWNQFGFWGLGHSDTYRAIRFEGIMRDPQHGSRALVRICDEKGNRRQARMALRQGRMVRE